MVAGDELDEVLETILERREILGALAEEPHHRQELEDRFDISKTTCHRVIQAFDDHGLIRRTESGYALSPLGAVLAHQVLRLETGVEQAVELAPLLALFDADDSFLDTAVFGDGDIEWSIDQEGAFTIDRGMELVADSEVLRVLDWTPVPELYIERIYELLMERGMRVESVYPEAVISTRLEKYDALHAELIQSEAKPRYWVYDDVPVWGLSIYDDEVVQLRGYDRESGAYILDATSQSSAAIEWGMDVFEWYRERADPVTEVESLPDWGDYNW